MTSLRSAALINVATHAIAVTLAATVMREGTPLVGYRRLDWLAGEPLGWTAGWIAWMICAIALVVMVSLAVRAGGASPRLARTVVLLAVIGASIDMLCDAVWIVLVPSLAAHDVHGFLVAERVLGFIGQVVANGLYSVAVLLCAFSYRRPLVRLLGAGTFVAGLGIVAAGLAGEARWLELATGPTMAFYCAWSLATAFGREGMA